MTATVVTEPESKDVPRGACQLRAAQTFPVRFAETPAEGAAADGDEPQIEQGRFRMEPALAGAILGHWYWGNLFVDFDGLDMPKQVAVLQEHWNEKRLGFTTSLKVEKGVGLVVEGQFLDNEHAAAVRADAEQGFPWEASVHLTPLSVEYVERGVTAKVNGQSVQGPANVFRQSRLREVSFVTIGADAETSAQTFNEKDTLSVPHTRREPMTEKKTDAAEPQGQDVKAASEEAQKIERERVSAILAETTPEQQELAQKLIADGVELSDARKQINDDLRKRLSEKPSAGDAARFEGSADEPDTQSLQAGGGSAGGVAAGAAPEGADPAVWEAWTKLSAKEREGYAGQFDLFASYEDMASKNRFYKVDLGDTSKKSFTGA